MWTSFLLSPDQASDVLFVVDLSSTYRLQRINGDVNATRVCICSLTNFAMWNRKHERALSKSALVHCNLPNLSCSLTFLSTKLVSALDIPRRNAPANEAPPVGPVYVASMSTLPRVDVSWRGVRSCSLWVKCVEMLHNITHDNLILKSKKT